MGLTFFFAMNTIHLYSLVLTLILPSVLIGSEKLSANPQPNIILIFVDDMAYGDASCYDGTLIETPHIDRLAEAGIRFTQGYTISPVCGPSRVGLLTGTQPGRFGIYWNPDMGAVQIPSDRPLLSVQLSNAGYTTGIVGKWNLSNPHWDPMPVKKYFDHTYNTMVWEGDYWPNEDGHYHGVEDKKYGSTKTNNVWGPTKQGDEYLTDILSNNACEFISQNSGSEKPFFLYLAYNAPHSPLQGKAIHKEKLAHIQSEALKLYASMLLSVDEGVGKILDTIEAQGIKEDTLVVFLSDNGPAVTNFKGLPKAWPRDQMLGSTNGLRGRKGQYFEGGIRVPFIASWPGQIKPNQSSNQLVSAMDLYPTFSTLAGIELPQNHPFEGRDLAPLFQSSKKDLEQKNIFWIGGRVGKNCGALRSGHWKLLVNHQGADYLFNLKDDPYEAEDLKHKNPERYQELKALFNKEISTMPEPKTDRSKLKNR